MLIYKALIRRKAVSKNLLHTPEGVRDVYDTECARKRYAMERIKDVLHSFGCRDIETPSFEYFDIFNMDTGSAPSNEMYKFFDRENNTLVLRPDFTPSVARCAAKYYAEEQLPLRLTYEGSAFINAHQHQGKLSEFTQIGAEFINDDSSAADAEIVACVTECMLAVGLKEFQIELSNVDFFRGLIDEAGLDEETAERIREFIHAKNFYGLSAYVDKLDISEDIKRAITGFEGLFGGVETLDKAAVLVKNGTSLEAVERLRRVYAAIEAYGYGDYVSFDLSMINRYNYYTGIVFRAYTYGTGDAVVKGGRYNHLLAKFGKEAPSVGFSVYVDDLMNALTRNRIELDVDILNELILYEREQQAEAIKLATALRSEGRRVELVRKSARFSIDDYREYASRMHIRNIYKIREDGSHEILDICAG